MTPTQLVMKLPCDSKKPALASLLERKKSLLELYCTWICLFCSIYFVFLLSIFYWEEEWLFTLSGEYGRSDIVQTPFAVGNSWTEVAA
jgi:hypothetical protein